jgi:hypothetical protein
MCDGPDGGFITQARQQTPEHCLKVGAFAPGSSMSGLSTRRMYLLHFAERLLEFSSALSCFPDKFPPRT